MNSVIGVLTLMLLAVLVVLVYRLRSHPQEWEDLVLVRLRRWRAFWTTRRLVKWIGIPFACWAAVFCISIRTELAEAYERIQCGGDACPALTAQELRFRFIKSYLHYMLNERKPSSDGCCYDQLVLLPINISTQSLMQEPEDATLLTTLIANALPLKNHEDIDDLTPSVLVTHPSIAGISRSQRDALIIPMQSMQPIHLEDVDVDYTKRNPYEEVARQIGRWERLRGYGKHFFEVTEYWGVDISCCDGKGRHRNEGVVERKRRSIDRIQSKPLDALVLAASDRGNILFWEDERAENSDILTPILFFTKSNF